MSEKDRTLIRDSYLTQDWSEIDKLISQAESETAKQILQDRKIHLYRREESFANQL